MPLRAITIVLSLACLQAVIPPAAARSSPPRPDSTGVQPATPESVTVVTKTGSVGHFARVEPWPNGYVRGIHGNGAVVYIAAERIQWVRDSRGEDATPEVLERGKGVGSMPPGSAVRKQPLFRGRPLPEQQRFHLLQAGVMRRIDSTDEGEEPYVGTIDLGTMKNVTPAVALGGTLALVADANYVRIGLKPRLRRWLSRTISLDVAPGVFAGIDTDDSSLEHGPVGFVGETSLILGDWGAITGQIEVTSVEYVVHAPGLPESILADRTESDVSIFLGGKVGGSLFAVPGALLVAAVALIGLTVSTDR